MFGKETKDGPSRLAAHVKKHAIPYPVLYDAKGANSGALGLKGYPAAFVLDRSGSVAGYAILSIAAGEAHILNLCVDPKYRQLGYGEKLLDAVLSQAAGAEVREIFLEVRPSNRKAIALYEKKGFRQVASRPAYYQAREGREDAAVLSRIIRKP